LIPFVLIRSAVATFYARKDTATPVKAALIGVAANVALKIALVGSLAQVGLAVATSVGAWINLLLVIAFAVRSGFLRLDSALAWSGAKFAASGVLLAAALWLTAHLSTAYVSGWSAWRDETTFMALIVVGAVVYAPSILLLFGRDWLKSLLERS
jgi:putative peptidoglycan lipid II flippase